VHLHERRGGNLCWYGGGKSVAIITPALVTFAKSTLAWTATKTTSAGAGPYEVSWEESESKRAIAFVGGLAFQATNNIQSITELLNVAGDARVARDIAEWMDLQRRARAKTAFTKEEIVSAINQVFIQRRRTSRADSQGWRAMTVHGAKNREFDNVIVLWPAAMSGSDDQKRRLLYNAVTRAKLRCLVLVEATKHLKQAPFS
jgi:superfamily I DNA/RNA helicase